MCSLSPASGRARVGKLEDLVTSKVPLPMFFPAPSPLPERSRHLWSRENRTLPCRLTRGAVWSPAGQSGQSGQPGLRRRSSVPGGAVPQPPCRPRAGLGVLTSGM